MRLRHPSLLALVLPLCATTAQTKETTSKPTPEACESKTINYITHTLPQQCLRTNWATANSTLHNSTALANETATASSTPATATKTDTVLSGQASAQTEAAATEKKEDASTGANAVKGEQDDSEELATSSFMSFEEWKAMMLQKSGQDPADLRGRKHQEGRDGAEGESLDTWGDDGEIALDFNVLSDKISEMTATASARNGGPSGDASSPEGQESSVYDNGVAHYKRPKDAGKTCKERFSYSSFDGGATVLKTSPGVKNAKAILVENKDSYMLFTCSQENKFVIVELSEDILVDTIVLANFEFFSSMIRTFRVSVSDKYPVKMEKWKDLGTFQARNSRDIQSFLVENPKIWAKYIRIEFVSHYGNEYYCPVSLLRVHGTRMLDSWKDAEAGADDDEPAETISSPEAAPEPEVPQENTTVPESQPTGAPELDTPSALNDSYASQETSPWYAPLSNETDLDVCRVGTPTTPVSEQITPPLHAVNESSLPAQAIPSTDHARETAKGDYASTPSTVESNSTVTTPSSSVDKSTKEPTSSASNPATPSNDTADNNTLTVRRPPKSSMTTPKSPSAPRAGDTSIKSSTKHSTNGNHDKTSSSSTTTSAASTPTVQESFFKSISKRLQFLESNTTLSLQYIEDQSKFLQEALQKMERRQISRVDSFLNNLNNTVLSELHNVRQQYDQIWQSTVLALETQREQSQREIIALSSRLNLLADEVVFQKRMAIFQSVLLLCCLVLVLFSRGVLGGGGGNAGGSLGDQWTMAATSQFINSYLSSPRWPPGSPVSGSRGNTPKHPQHRLHQQQQQRRTSAGAMNMPRRTSTNLHPHDGQQQRSVSGPAVPVSSSSASGTLSRGQSYTDKMLPLTPTSESFDDSSENNTPTMATVPSSTTQRLPRIRVDVSSSPVVDPGYDEAETPQDTYKTPIELYKDGRSRDLRYQQQVAPKQRELEDNEDEDDEEEDDDDEEEEEDEDEEDDEKNITCGSINSIPTQELRRNNSSRSRRGRDIMHPQRAEEDEGHAFASSSSGEDSSASAATIVNEGAPGEEEELEPIQGEEDVDDEEEMKKMKKETEQILDGKSPSRRDHESWHMASPSKPPLTRSPLSELGGIMRKPLPALPEDPT